MAQRKTQRQGQHAPLLWQNADGVTTDFDTILALILVADMLARLGYASPVRDGLAGARDDLR